MAEKIENYDPDNPRYEDLPQWVKDWCEKWKGERQGNFLVSKTKSDFKLDINQYKMLLQCSRNKNTKPWNEYRAQNKNVQVWLCGANLKEKNLAHVNFKQMDNFRVALRGAVLSGADLHGAKFSDADLTDAMLAGDTNIKDVEVFNSILDHASFSRVKIDSRTYFKGSILDSAFFDPKILGALKYNIRRIGWHKWYEEGCPLLKPLKLLTGGFWSISNYGISSVRIFIFFILFSTIYAFIYWTWPCLLEADENIKVILKEPTFNTFIYDLYFSVVTMTTLGFGDIYANPKSPYGQLILMSQVIMGYILLGALVTRLGVVFTGLGPVKKPELADEDREEHEIFIIIGLSIVASLLFSIPAFIEWRCHEITAWQVKVRFWESLVFGLICMAVGLVPAIKDYFQSKRQEKKQKKVSF